MGVGAGQNVFCCFFWRWSGTMVRDGSENGGASVIRLKTLFSKQLICVHLKKNKISEIAFGGFCISSSPCCPFFFPLWVQLQEYDIRCPCILSQTRFHFRHFICVCCHQTWTPVWWRWNIWALIVWMLLINFFWCSTCVIPNRTTSLEDTTTHPLVKQKPKLIFGPIMK